MTVFEVVHLWRRRVLTSIARWSVHSLYISALSEHRHVKGIVVAQELTFRKRPSETTHPAGLGSRQRTDAVSPVCPSSASHATSSCILQSVSEGRRLLQIISQLLTQRLLCDFLLRLPFCLSSLSAPFFGLSQPPETKAYPDNDGTKELFSLATVNKRQRRFA